MMAFNVKIRDGKTIRTNLSITKSFNADYDGDEMNIFAPNSPETEAELRLLSSVQNHFISNQSNKPNIVIVQDGMLGNYLMTAYEDPIPYPQFLHILEVLENRAIPLISQKAEIYKQKCPDKPVYSGKLLFSCLLPTDMFYKKGDVIIEEGVLIAGNITKTQLGSSHDSLIVIFNHIYGPDRCEQFLNDVQFLAYSFLMFHGFSIGLKDCLISKDVEQDIQHLVDKHFMEASLCEESIKTPQILEASISNILSNTRNVGMKTAKDSLSPENNFLATVTSGSKGDYFNITQVMALLGQQNFQGQRIQPTISNDKRTLPHIPFDTSNDLDTKFRSQGFIRNSFLKGLDPMEFWFHAITGREGITDTAMKSVTWETRILILVNNKPICIEIGKWIDNLLDMNPRDVITDEQNREEIKIQNVLIPTTDYHGNVTWGEVSMATRHDPGRELFEIRTESGRSVIVTESKSLLIWEEESQEFKEKPTPEVQIGDYVPSTHFLCPPTNSFERFQTESLYDLGTIFGIYFANGSFISEISLILETRGDDYIYNFIVKWLKEHSIYNYFDHGNCIECENYLELFQYFTTYDIHDLITYPDEYIKGFLNGYVRSTSNINDPIIKIDSHIPEIINILCSRIGIFCELSRNTLIITHDREKFDKIVLQRVPLTYENPSPKILNNVILDKIIEIHSVDMTNHPKVYDLTIPSTFNFGLANGLQVRDTATSGYIQRRMVKVAEDVQVKYDGTVRNSANSILQFRYGYHNMDPSQSVIVKNEEHKPMMFFADVDRCAEQLNYTFEKNS
jgi:hypothetical protein